MPHALDENTVSKINSLSTRFAAGSQDILAQVSRLEEKHVLFLYVDQIPTDDETFDVRISVKPFKDISTKTEDDWPRLVEDINKLLDKGFIPAVWHIDNRNFLVAFLDKNPLQ